MGISAVFKVLYSQLFVTPPSPHFDCSGKTFIVTGANTGLGKEAARHFVQAGAHKVIIGCRSTEKGEAAKKDIEDSTNRPGVVEVWPLDLQSFESVKTFADRIGQLDRVDALVENAGINTHKFRWAAGYESTITVNVVGTFLLALLALPHLQTMGTRYNFTPTITFVNSEVHGFTSFPERNAAAIFETLNDEKEARMTDRYNVSKLLGVLACREIANEHSVDRLNITMNLVNPGLCHSGLVQEMDSPAVRIFLKMFARTTEVGSRTLVHAAMQDSSSHGKYFSDCRIAPFEGFVRSKQCPEVQKKVWEELAVRLEQIVPGVTKIKDNSDVMDL